MATQAGTAIGTAIGGPIGGAIGAVIGSFIDQELFGPDTPDGPRLNDLKVTTATYGSAIPLVYGPQNRLGGNVIWATDLVEREGEESGGKGGGDAQTTYTYSVSCAVAVCARQIKQVRRIWANNKVFFDLELNEGVSPTEDIPALDTVNGTTYKLSGAEDVDDFKSIFSEESGSRMTIYAGSAEQLPDPFIEGYQSSLETPTDTPAYRNIAYIVFKEFELADYGNRIPNFEFELEVDETITIAGVLDDLADRSDIGVTSVAHLGGSDPLNNLPGYVIGRQTQVYQAIQALSATYNFDIAEQFGQIRFVKKSKSMRGSISIIEMGASSPGSGGTSPVEYGSKAAHEMPEEVSIVYSDPALDYQKNSQTEFKRSGTSNNKLMMEVPCVIDADTARQMADRIMWSTWARRQSFSFSLSDKWIRLMPGNMVGIQTIDEYIPCVVVKVTRGDNGVIAIEAVGDSKYNYDSDVAGVAGNRQRQTFVFPGASEGVLMDAPLLIDSDAPDGFYWASSGESEAWRGTSLFRSTDTIAYNNIDKTSLRSKIGYVTGTVPSGTTVVFDNATEIEVVMVSSTTELESVSQLDVLNGQNVAWIGPRFGGIGEIVQFQNAELTGVNTYKLTKLLRGRLGSEYAVGTHTSDDVFVLLESGILRSQGFGISDWDKDRDYKAVTNTTSLANTDNIDFINTGVRSAPLSPAQTQGSRDASDNLTITWIRRSRMDDPGMGNGDPALGESTEAYEVDVFDSSVVVRTISVTAETASYTAAEQTTDGVTLGGPLEIEVYQVSETRGRGFAAEALV